MTLTTVQKILLGTNIIIVLGFGWYFFQALNYEFLAYTATIALVTAVLFSTLRWTHFSNTILVGVTIWGLFHMLGGSLMTSDGVLYAYKIYPFFDGGGDLYILKMDQVVHAFLYGVVGLMFFQVLRKVVLPQTSVALVATIAIFAAAGFSIINEIVEFLAVVNLPETGVGGYYNTVLDMAFNLFGALVAVLGQVFIVNWQQRRASGVLD